MPHAAYQQQQPRYACRTDYEIFYREDLFFVSIHQGKHSLAQKSLYLCFHLFNRFLLADTPFFRIFEAS